MAGVCAAIARATNTDPVLWRVLLAVLGLFGGIGVLVYVAAWLVIPAEGDSASPIESMLGRGRSSMSPVTVILLAVLVAVMFAFIVTNGFRSVLLGTAILIGGALLLNREAARQRSAPTPGPEAAAGPGPAAWFPTAHAPAPGDTVPGVTDPNAATGVTAPDSAATAPGPKFAPAVPNPVPQAPGGPAPAGPAHPLFSAGQLGPHAVPAAHSAGYSTAQRPAGGPGSYPASGAPIPPPAGPAGPAAGYRPPFAPHGPYAPGGYPPSPAAPAPKPPKPPRERSPLGAATFSMIFVAIGLVAVLDLSGAVPIGPSAYFAGVLVTTALGLLVGAWFGRARWLIAIGLAAALALGISTLAESSDAERLRGGPVLWRPTSVDELASGYENNFGDATLDLTAVDFMPNGPTVTAKVNFGRLVVIVPRDVDVTAVTDVNAGDATIFGQRSGGMQGAAREVTDLGPDGPGGGTLRLYLHVNAGELEVRR